MATSETGIFDGTFKGFLSAASWALASSDVTRTVRKASGTQANLFASLQFLPYDPERAHYLWEWLGQKGTAKQRLVYFAFLSEAEGVESLLLRYLQVLLPATQEDRDTCRVLESEVSHLAMKVSVARERLEKRLIFTPSGSQPARCNVSPEYDILPLLSKGLRQRFGSQSWMLYDRRRHYGLLGTEGRVSLFSNRTSASPACAFYGQPVDEKEFEVAAWEEVRPAV